MSFSEIVEKLKSAEKITFSNHFSARSDIRGITSDEILEILKFPENAQHIEDQGEEQQGHKYAMLFEKSGKYDLKIVVSIKDKALNVVTAHIQNRKRAKVLEKWLKSKK